MPIINSSGFESQIPSSSEIPSAEKEQINNVKTECQRECQALSTTVETHQRFLNYAKNYEAQFGEENVGVVAKILEKSQRIDFPDEDLLSYSQTEIFELIQTKVQLQIQKNKIFQEKSEQTQHTTKKQETISAQEVSIGLLKKDVFSHIGPQNISGLKSGVNKLHEKGEISQAVLEQALGFVAQHEATLRSFGTFFQPEEQAVFNTILTNTRLNLSANSSAEIYADVFAQIDAGIADHDRRLVLKNKIAEKLGFKANQRPQTADQLMSQLYRREQAIAQGITDESGEPLSLDRNHKVQINDTPPMFVYRNPTNASDYLCEAQVANADPIYLPFDRETPNAVLNARMNQQMMRGVYANHGAHGAMAAMLGTGQNITHTTAQTTETAFAGNDQYMEVLLRMELGQNTLLHSRFLTQAELDEIADNARYKVPGGDLGAFNAIDPTSQTKLMKGLGFEKTSSGQETMLRAGDLYRGKIAEKSYENLYRLMYPEDVKAGFPTLRATLGDELFQRLAF